MKDMIPTPGAQSDRFIKTALLGVMAAAALMLATACDRAPDPAPEQAQTPEPAPMQEQPETPVVTDRQAVNNVADKYYEAAVKFSPEVFYFSGIKLDRHDTMSSNRPEDVRELERIEDELLAEIAAVDGDSLAGSTEWITHAYLLQTLQSSVNRRICRNDLWNVNQMGGWHSGFAQIAHLQPVGTPELREQSIARWSKLPGFIDQEIANLRKGLEAGYSAPQPVVSRVIEQVDGVLALDVEQSPFYSPALRDNDAEFVENTRQLVADGINPALTRYRDFLENEYLPNARTELSILGNPDGAECYQASLQYYTTLARSGREVFELGQQTVEANRARVVELGKSAYGLEDFDEIMERTDSDPNDRFTSKEELLEFSREMVRRAEAVMPDWVGKMPQQPVEVVPFEEHEEGTGRSAHYRPASDDRPGEYRIPLHQPEEQSRGNAEAVAFHEAWPGHHLQVAIAQSVEGMHPVTRIIWFSGPGEGWARYSEALAEEMGLYTTTTGPIKRRAWPARGMVVDPGIHLYGWTREQAIEFMLESGRFPASQADDMVDRIAILPGQLTAYDSGGLEILALRSEAEQALGDSFDIREFHDRILENGTIPLIQLRMHIENWIENHPGRVN